MIHTAEWCRQYIAMVTDAQSLDFAGTVVIAQNTFRLSERERDALRLAYRRAGERIAQRNAA